MMRAAQTKRGSSTVRWLQLLNLISCRLRSVLRMKVIAETEQFPIQQNLKIDKKNIEIKKTLKTKIQFECKKSENELIILNPIFEKRFNLMWKSISRHA